MQRVFPHGNGGADPLFPGFRTQRIATSGAEIHAVVGPRRSGPAILLLHGYPQTHAIWHHVAWRLAERFNVVATDLRGYGDSSKPESDEQHAPYTKRAMALDQVEVMRALGHESFFVVGHDRGGRVAHRMALDHPDAVRRLVVLDIAPTLAMYEGTTEAFARAYWHWFFLILPAPYPETMLGADPKTILRAKMGSGSAGLGIFTREAWAEYERCFTPEMIHASCEDYRASASTDLVHDRADRAAGKRVTQPLLALWGTNGVVHRCFDPLALWKAVAYDARGAALPGGHYLAEEIPDIVLAELEHFLVD
ncbi:MAG: alpha/beta hydrolase [Gemmatimonadetes bacterium]|nr:alpha/beta hydrolase [Gemmatimonadota bacterium]